VEQRLVFLLVLVVQLMRVSAVYVSGGLLLVVQLLLALVMTMVMMMMMMMIVGSRVRYHFTICKTRNATVSFVAVGSDAGRRNRRRRCEIVR